MEWLSLLLPFGYLTVLLASLGTFSHLYRRRKALQSTSLQPWFPPHTQRQIYLTLLEQASAPSEKGTPKIPDSVLRAALLRRATEDIHRLIQLRSAKPALSQLLQRGAVGDELFQRFQIAEKEMEAELRDVVQEANALAGPGQCGGQGQPWGQTIFQNAGECAHSDVLRGKLRDIEAERESERAAWERQRTEMREGLMKELDGSSEPAKTSEKDDAVLVEKGSPTAGNDQSPSHGGAKSKKNKK